MNKKGKLLFVFFLFFLIGCSFDNKTGIWSGNEKERNKTSTLSQTINITKVKSSSGVQIFSKEINSAKRIKLIKPKEVSSWPVPELNVENFTGNLSYSGFLKLQLKKKIGKNKYPYSAVLSSPLIFNNTILFTDNNGSVFNINQYGKINWKVNIYKKINKKFFKILSHAFYEGILYVSDNIGYLYAINAESGEIIWKKNYGVPFKSHIKLFNKKIYLVDQDGRIVCFDFVDGSKIWELGSASRFIKSQEYLALAISKSNYAFFINTAGDLTKVNLNDGIIEWFFPTLDISESSLSDFFSTSNIVIENDTLFFSDSLSNTYSINLSNGYLNWKNEVGSTITPIINNDNLFVLTENGYLVNVDRNSGNVVWSKNILKKIKTSKRKGLKMSGFIMGSDRIYATTSNGHLFVCSAISGEVEFFDKIAKSINVGPIISNGKLYILTGNSKIMVFS